MKHISYGTSTILVIVVGFFVYEGMKHIPDEAYSAMGILLFFVVVFALCGFAWSKVHAGWQHDHNGHVQKKRTIKKKD